MKYVFVDIFTCSTLLLFPYPMPAGSHGSVQHVKVWNVPVDVLPRLLSWFNQVKHLECRGINPPREVQCVHMYSVAWDALVFCTNHYLTVLTYGHSNIRSNLPRMTLYWGMCKVIPHFGCSSVADVYRYITA